MEKTVSKCLNIELDKKSALSLYYRLTIYLRENDPLSFGKLMEHNDGKLKDGTLMQFVLNIMLAQHPEMLTNFVKAIAE